MKNFVYFAIGSIITVADVDPGLTAVVDGNTTKAPENFSYGYNDTLARDPNIKRRDNIDRFLKKFEDSENYFLKLRTTIARCQEEYDMRTSDMLAAIDNILRRIKTRIDVIQTTKKMYNAWPHMIHKLKYDLGFKPLQEETLKKALNELDEMKQRFHKINYVCETKFWWSKSKEEKPSTTEKFDVVLDDLKEEFSKLTKNRYNLT